MKKSWDSIAGVYDLLAGLVFGRAIRKAQLVWMSQLPKGGKVLIVGGGTGWILPICLQELAPEHLLFVDISAKMIEKAKRKIQGLPLEARDRVAFHQGKFEELKLEDSFDLIFTPFFLDLFPDREMNACMDRLYAHLKEDGLWVFADFQYPSKGLLKPFAKGFVGVMYFFFSRVTGIGTRRLPDFQAGFSRLKMNIVSEKSYYLGMIRSVLFQK